MAIPLACSTAPEASPVACPCPSASPLGTTIALHLMMQPGVIVQSKPLTARIVGFHGELVIPGAVIAPLHPVALDLRCPDPGQHAKPQKPVKLRAWLTHPQVRALDLARGKDGDFDLHARLTCQATGSDGLLVDTVSDSKQITSSDWTRILREMKFEDRATFEVPIEGGRVAAPLDVAAKHMRDALDQLQQRNWDGALVKCREVLDELGKHQSVLAWPQSPDWSKATTWGVPERVVAMQWAIRHLTHAGAHAKIGSAEEQEVRLAVTTTAAVVNYYASR